MKLESYKNKIGINISGLLWNGGYRKNNQFNMLTDYQELMICITSYFIKNGYEIVFVPHTYGNINEDDLIASQELKSLIEENKNQIEIVCDNYSEQELKCIISNLEFFIGARMHACIAAISTNVPTIGIAYSRKFKGVFETIGVGNYVLDPRKLEKQEIMSKIEKLFENREEFKVHTKEMMPKVIAKIKEDVSKTV